MKMKGEEEGCWGGEVHAGNKKMMGGEKGNS